MLTGKLTTEDIIVHKKNNHFFVYLVFVNKDTNDPGQFQPNPFHLGGSIFVWTRRYKSERSSFRTAHFYQNTDHAAPALIDSESAMQYAHMGLQDRRDQTLDANGSVWPLIHAF